MKAVILAGGLGTRLSEETELRPKPMVEIGGRPILWHIMKIYSAHGLNDFIICCGYKGYMVKEYFANYLLHMSDVTINLQNNKLEIHRNLAEHIATIANLSRSISDVVAYRKEAMIVLGGQIEQHSKTAEDLATENAILRADIAKKSAELEAMDLLRERLENDIQALREEMAKKKSLWRR